MLRIQTRLWAPLLVAFAVAACGERDARADVAAPAASAAAGSMHADADANPAAADADTPSEGTAPGRVEVTLSKAPFAGAHQMTGEMTCTMYNGVWQATLEQERASGLSGVLVMLKEVPQAGGTTDKVTLNLLFGENGDGNANSGVVDVHGTETGGDGRGSVSREGDGAVLRVEGTTLAGARAVATVRCGSVEFLQ